MPNRPIHILYVDDDEALARLVARACQRRGYSVTYAPTVEAALGLLGSEDFSLVILDHDLRTRTGLDFLSATDGQAGRPPVIYVTGSAETSVAVAALKAGAYDYVWKSASGDFLDLLFASIEPALERGRLERARLRAEQEMREARERAELMLAEVNHRIANSLALVASLVRLQSSVVSDPGAIAALNETRSRIQAIGSVHRRLYRSTDIGQVALDQYLGELIGDLESGFRDEGRAGSIELRADPVAVSTDQTVAVGVIVTELVTNAMKYAYPDGTVGPIRVILRAEGPQAATIAVEDDGAGWDGTGQAQGSGLGMRIIRAMLTNLNAELAYEPVPKGTSARFSLKGVA